MSNNINNNTNSTFNISNNTNNNDHDNSNYIEENNVNNSVDNDVGNNELFESTNDYQWEQDRDQYQQFRDTESFEHVDGYRGGNVLRQQNFHSTGSPYFQDTSGNFTPVMSNPWGGKNLNTHMVSNDSFTTNYDSNFLQEFTVKNNTGDFGTSDFSINNDIGTSSYINTNVNYTPNTLGPVPVYTNLNQNFVNTSCHLSNEVAHVIQSRLKKMLETMLETNKLQIDYQVDKKNPYEFHGRVYTSSSSDFTVKIYKLKEQDNKGNISAIEIRNVFGDEFGFYEFEKSILEKLENEKIIVKQEVDKDLFGEIGSLTLGDDDETDDDDEFGTFNDVESSVNENDEEFDHNLCEIMLETLYNKDSFREEYMHDAYQLATYLEKNDDRAKNMINYILKNESKTLLQNIISPIKASANKFYCAFIILRVLEAIDTLLSKKDVKSKLIIPESFTWEITSIQNLWSDENGVQTNVGNMNVKFVKSQQIENKCISIKNKLLVNNM